VSVLSMEIIYQLLVAYQLVVILIPLVRFIRICGFREFVGFIRLTPPKSQVYFEHGVALYLLKQLELFIRSLETFYHSDKSFVLVLPLPLDFGVRLLHKYIE
jgi:hypothetical protein